MYGRKQEVQNYFEIAAFKGGDFFMPQKKCWLFVVARPRVLCYDENIRMRVKGNEDDRKAEWNKKKDFTNIDWDYACYGSCYLLPAFR